MGQFNVRRPGLSETLVAAVAAAALAWAAPVAAQSAAQKAVDAAKKICSGKTITIVWEAGLQSLDPLNFSGPKWESSPACKVKVVEVPTAEMFTKIMQEYRAGTGAYDALNVIPAWMPDLVQAGALEQLDSYVDKYGFRARIAEDRADLPRQPDDGERQDLRFSGRRRRVRHVLPQGHLRAGGPQERLQGEVQIRPRAAQDLEAVRRHRQLPHREAEERRHLRRLLLPRAAATRSSCSKSASATKAASSSTPAA